MNTFINSVLTDDYLSENPILNKGSWRSFKKEANKKEIILFGAGEACKSFIKKYKRKYNIKCIYDNSPSKWGTKIFNIDVKNPKEILNEDINQKVILITTTSYMNEIANQLDEMKIKKYYGLCVLESKKIYLQVIKKIILTYIWKLKRVKKNKILISSGNNYSCNCKYIVNELNRQKVDCEIVWLTNNTKDFPENVIKVKPTIFNIMIQHSTSKIWIDNYKKKLWIRKKKKQYYINVWHGSIPFKKIDFDTTASSESHLKRTIYDSSLCDLRISNSDFCSNIYKMAMKYEGNILKVGTPRIDSLFQYSKNIVKKIYNIPIEAKILLFAPTFREVTKSGMYGPNTINIDFVSLLKTLESNFGGEWYILFKLHPSIANYDNYHFNNDHIIGVSNYSDIYEIMQDTDILMTDYSSVMFEFSTIYKPVFIYADDYEEYSINRQTYFKLNELPYPIAQNMDELIDNIINFDYKIYKQKVKEFNKKLGLVEDGKASSKVVDVIKKIIEEK